MGSLEIRNFEGEQTTPDSSQGRGITANSDRIYRNIGAGSLEIRNFEGEQTPPDSFQGHGSIANGDKIYRGITNPHQIATESIGTLERDHWRSVNLRANIHHLTAPKDAGSPQIAT